MILWNVNQTTHKIHFLVVNMVKSSIVQVMTIVCGQQFNKKYTIYLFKLFTLSTQQHDHMNMKVSCVLEVLKVLQILQLCNFVISSSCILSNTVEFSPRCDAYLFHNSVVFLNKDCMISLSLNFQSFKFKFTLTPFCHRRFHGYVASFLHYGRGQSNRSYERGVFLDGQNPYQDSVVG